MGLLARQLQQGLYPQRDLAVAGLPLPTTDPGGKLKELLKNIFCMCQYAMDVAYEGRKDINDMKRQLGLEVREIPLPPVFQPYEDSSEDDEDMEYPNDQEMLGERMNILRHERGQSRPQVHSYYTQGQQGCCE